MTDKEKKETLCIFITPSERLGEDNNGTFFYKCCGGNEQKYFEKFYNHAVLPLEFADCDNVHLGYKAIQDENVKNVQVIFDIHGDDKGLSISEEEMHEILEPIFNSLLKKGSLKDTKIEIIMANCQGNLKFNGYNSCESLPKYLENWATDNCVNPENISLYCMPKGHNANIQFNDNGDIFFISNNASKSLNGYIDNTVVATCLYTKENPEVCKPDTYVTFNNDVKIQLEEPFEKDDKTKKKQPLLQCVYKGRPPKIDLSTGEQLPTGLVLYKEPLVSKIKNEPDLNLNKKNEINTTTKK